MEASARQPYLHGDIQPGTPLFHEERATNDTEKEDTFVVSIRSLAGQQCLKILTVWLEIVQWQYHRHCSSLSDRQVSRMKAGF